MAPVPAGASELPRSKPKTASPKRFAWRLYPFTTTSPTWATITALNAPATVPSKPPRTPLINSPASFIISLKLGSLMMKLFLQSLKLVTKNTVCTSYKLSLGKWVTHSCRPMRDPQFLERGIALSMTKYTPVKAPRGTTISCKGWQQEGALRMLTNNLDEEVAENPRQLIVYGGSGRATRSWDAFHAIVRALRTLENDETLLVQSGKPVGTFRTFPHSPRVLIANANLVPHWATRDEFNRLEALQLTMYGQMTAGSWIYIGTQGIVQGTYETFAAAARTNFGGSLEGKILVTGGMGGMGGAQPLAATMNGAAFLGIEVDPARLQRRIDTGYLDTMTRNLDEAWTLVTSARDERRPLSVGLVGNCADVLPEMVRRGWIADVLTDQTSAHDPLNGYVPRGLTLDEAAKLRESDPN